MALSQNVLQKKRTKKNTKRNDKRATSARLGALLGFSRDWAAASRAVVDVLAPCNLFELGIGRLWFSRRLPDGRYAMAGFLVDTFCLGVKNALYKIMETCEYQGALERIFSATQEGHEQQHPAYARVPAPVSQALYGQRFTRGTV
jgi:hypothetical protein